MEDTCVCLTGRFVRTDLALDAPVAEAMLVRDGRIAAIGGTDDVPAPAGARRVDLGEGWTIPGLIEPHGHPSQAANQLSAPVVDIRPVVVDSADEVWRLIRAELARRPEWVLANGWDPLLQKGLTEPHRRDLDQVAGAVPLVIVHNSGHTAYFNSAAARMAGVDRDTPDPAGARFGRDASGDLDGVAYEAAAVLRMAGPALRAIASGGPQVLAGYLRDLRDRGVTTVGDLSWQHESDALVEGLAAADALPVRLRTYEMSQPGGRAGVPLDNGDAWVRQVGVKIWSDGSPWVGNIATSFPYLDTPATRAIGLAPGHVGQANYTTEQLIGIGAQYAGDGWQLACHAHGDLAVESTLDAYEELIRRFDLRDHRFRIEHCGLMTPAQFRRAADLGVTVSLFVDHITYWGDVLIDDLFGGRGAAWADAGAAAAAGHRVTFHNDGTVTPCEPLRNMAVAETHARRAPAGAWTGDAACRARSLCARTRRTPPGSYAASTRSAHWCPDSSPTSRCSTSIRAPRTPKPLPPRACWPRPSEGRSGRRAHEKAADAHAAGGTVCRVTGTAARRGRGRRLGKQ